jgi:hypothetical protein
MVLSPIFVISQYNYGQLSGQANLNLYRFSKLSFEKRQGGIYYRTTNIQTAERFSATAIFRRPSEDQKIII